MSATWHSQPVKICIMIRFPVIASIQAALYFTYSNIGLVAKTAMGWLGIYALFTLVFQLIGIGEYLDLIEKIAFAQEFTADAKRAGYESLSVMKEKLEVLTNSLGATVWVHDLLDKLLSLIAFCAVSVAMFRAFLKDAEPPLIAFGKAEIQTLIYAIVYMAILAGMFYLLDMWLILPDIGSTVTGMFYMVFGLLLLFFTVRILLVFPAITLDGEPINPLTSWQLTKGHGWGLFGGMLLVILSSLPVSIFKITIGKVALPISIIWPAQLLLSMILLTFILSFIAASYQYLVQGKGQEKTAPLF